jgi:hypothetical protein
MAKRLPLKKMATRMMGDNFPDFAPMPDKRPGYLFRRSPRNLFFDSVILYSWQADRAFRVDVVTTVFSEWNRQYYHHQMRVAVGLENVRLASNMTPVEEAFYLYDGSEEDACRCLSAIATDLERYAMPFFDEYLKKAQADRLLQFGLRWIDARHKEIASAFSERPDESRQQSQSEFSVVRDGPHPLLANLKEDLRKYAWDINASKRERQETAILAIDLLNWTHEQIFTPKQ